MWFGSRPGAAVALASAAVLGFAAPAWPHAALVELAPAEGVAVQARYDDGTAMAGAQIVVFAPDDPQRPWLTGRADDEGWFRFVPAPDLAGRWTVQARQAGHGAMAHVELGGEGAASVWTAPAGGGLSTAQRALVAGSVVWGLIGTGLVFHRRQAG